MPGTFNVTAVIPARGGSAGVVGKNMRAVGGRSLVQRAVDACLGATSVSSVVVTTDSTSIADEAERAGATSIMRPAEISGDSATSESALVHALDVLAEKGSRPDVAVFVQCTSPFIASDDLDNAVARVREGVADVVFSATESHAFLWRWTSGGAEGINHDHTYRQRRQDRETEYRESGAFYVMRTAGFLDAGFRFFGRVEPMAVPALHAVEIDTEDDLVVANLMAHINDVPEPIDVDALVMDFDGVHTDDRAFVDQDGKEAVAVSRSDGLGIARLRSHGVPMLVLSAERNPVVAARAQKLGVDVLQGVDDKLEAVQKWLVERGVDAARTAYVGNDLNDVECLEFAGWPVVVPGAHPEAQARARVVLTRRGGDGAVRELSERIIESRKGQVA